MDSSSACDAIDMLLLVAALMDGVVLAPRPLCALRAGLPLAFAKTLSVLASKPLASLLAIALDASDNMEAARVGGLTGSYAGLSGSTGIGRGVEGVECDAHFVPNPRVRAIGVVATGVDGAAVTGLNLLAIGVEAFAAVAGAAAAACRIICSGMADLGACVWKGDA